MNLEYDWLFGLVVFGVPVFPHEPIWTYEFPALVEPALLAAMTVLDEGLGG